jgi:hypothetical protein
VQNASAALDEVPMSANTRRLEVLASAAAIEVPADPGPVPAVAPPPPSRAEQRRQAARERRAARWEELRARHAADETLSGTARELGLDCKTVRRWLAHPDPPAAKGRTPRPPDLPSPSLQPYLRYLPARWQVGCTNSSQRSREIAAQGFTKSRSLVAQALLAWRGPQRAHVPHSNAVARRAALYLPGARTFSARRAQMIPRPSLGHTATARP